MRLDMGNMPQPDCLLFIAPEYGGHAQIDEDDYINGGPDLVAEVAASSVQVDMNGKLERFERNGVREYIVWRVLDREIDWLVFREARVEKLAPADDGILRSTIFPGLWLDPDALVRDDCVALMDVLQHGWNHPNMPRSKPRCSGPKSNRRVDR